MDIDRGLRSSRRSRNTILAKHAIWFFTKLSERLRLLFFVLNGEKEPMHHDRDIDHPFDFSAFCRTSTVSEHSKFRETCRCITHGKVLNLCHHDSFLHIFEQHHVQNEQLDSPDYGLVSSVVFIQLLFVSVSPSVLLHHSHTSSSRVNHAVIFFW